MNVKEKIESLQFLATTHRTEFENRRKVEWRVVILCMTFYALTLALKFKENFKVPPQQRLVIAVVFFALALAAIAFSLLIHRAHATNKIIAEQAETAIAMLLNGSDPATVVAPTGAPPRASIPMFLRNGKGIYGWWCQSVMVILFAVLTIILLFIS